MSQGFFGKGEGIFSIIENGLSQFDFDFWSALVWVFEEHRCIQ